MTRALGALPPAPLEQPTQAALEGEEVIDDETAAAIERLQGITAEIKAGDVSKLHELTGLVELLGDENDVASIQQYKPATARQKLNAHLAYAESLTDPVERAMAALAAFEQNHENLDPAADADMIAQAHEAFNLVYHSNKENT